MLGVAWLMRMHLTVRVCPDAGEEVAGKLSLRVQQLDVSVETKTKVCSLCVACSLIGARGYWLHQSHYTAASLAPHCHAQSGYVSTSPCHSSLPAIMHVSVLTAPFAALSTAGQCVCHDCGISSIPGHAW